MRNKSFPYCRGRRPRRPAEGSRPLPTILPVQALALLVDLPCGQRHGHGHRGAVAFLGSEAFARQREVLQNLLDQLVVIARVEHAAVRDVNFAVPPPHNDPLLHQAGQDAGDAGLGHAHGLRQCQRRDLGALLRQMVDGQQIAQVGIGQGQGTSLLIPN